MTSLSLARLAATAYSLVVALAVFAALRPTWRTHARFAARRVLLASRSAAERAAVAAVQEDRRARRALLEMEALPLLRGIAEGTLDPADTAVRERCARHAATLRRALIDRPQDAGGLLAELEPALTAARARGLWVEVQVVGDPAAPIPEVAAATLAAVDWVLSALPAQQVTLTVLASGDAVELYLTFGRPALVSHGHDRAEAAGARDRTVVRRRSMSTTPGQAASRSDGGPRCLRDQSSCRRRRYDGRHGGRRHGRGRCPSGGVQCGGAAKGGAGPAEGCGVPVGMIDVAAVDDHPIVLDGITGWVMAADSGIRVVATAATVASLLAGPGRRAHVVLLDLDLGDGTTVERNIAAITAAGPAVLVLAASDKPLSVLAAMRAGALGYVLKNEESAQVRAAIKAVAAGQDWISPRLAYIFAADDAPDRPSLSEQETRALRLYATGMPMKSVARRMTISEETAKQYVGRVREKYCPSWAGCANEIGPVLSSRRGRAPPASSLATDPPLRLGSWEIPALDH